MIHIQLIKVDEHRDKGHGGTGQTGLVYNGEITVIKHSDPEIAINFKSVCLGVGSF